MPQPSISAPAREVRIFKDAAAIAQYAASQFIAVANSAVAARGSFSVALAGGSTPKALYSLLVADPLRQQLPWDKMQIYFGDERHVAADDPESNFHMATETLISKAPLASAQVHRIKGEYPGAEKAALEYEEILRANFKLEPGELPRFDLLLAGMGNEGHTLSLFPGTRALHPGNRLVLSNWIGKLFTERITLTAPAACNAAQIIFMVAGADKSLALKAVLEGPFEPDQLPAQLLQPTNGKLLWLVDETAGAMLSSGIRQ